MSSAERSTPTGGVDGSADNKGQAPRNPQTQPANRTQRQPQGEQQQQSLTDTLKQLVSRALMAYFFITMFSGGFGGKKSASSPSPDSAVNAPSGFDQEQPHIHHADKLFPFWPPNTKGDLFVYISEEYNFTDFNNTSSLVWRSNDFELGNWDEDRVVDLTIAPSKTVQNNSTLYAHLYFAKQPAVIDPALEGFDVDNRVYTRKMLTRYYEKKKEFKVKKLVGGNQKEEEAQIDDVEETPKQGSTIISYWHQNLTIAVLSDRSVIPYNAVPPELKGIYQLESTGKRDIHGNGFVLPAVYPNDFWLLREHMYPINETVEELPLRINFHPISYMKLQLYSSLEVGFKQQSSMMGNSGGAEMDEFKRMLIETNPYLLLLTVAVSILHSAFEMLAFKNDIAFWKDKKGTGGLSVRAMFLDIIQQIVVFAYLVDNTQETSYMILFGQAVGLAIELWKIKKALKLNIVPATTGILPYQLHFDTSEPLTDLESKTKEYDEEAFKYLSWIAFPLLGVYALYSLLYQEHKSWYSFVLSTLVGFVYTFGFIKMTPQLFINYKLKSVAHMPFRTMMYKSLNTFIDDLFSFIIKMPLLHRLACLRDDVVFFVYLYQRHIYKTDHTRANEFGQVGEEESSEVVEKDTESKKDK